MASIIVKAPADAPHRKMAWGMGKALLKAMAMGKKKGDHLLVTETIPAGTYTLKPGNNADGYVQIDLSPGVEA